MTIEEYIVAKSSAEPAVLSELVRQTHLRVPQPRMLSGALQGQLLQIITAIVAPRRVLEVGTFTGYSTISIALALPDGAKIETIEIDDELESIASEFFVKAGVTARIEQHFGAALQVMSSMSGVFDLVFLDADKREYLEYYNTLFDKNLVGQGSVILADNTLWSGKVLLEVVDRKDQQTEAIKSFNDFVASDPRVEKVLLPLRDGLTLIRVK